MTPSSIERGKALSITPIACVRNKHDVGIRFDPDNPVEIMWQIQLMEVDGATLNPLSSVLMSKADLAMLALQIKAVISLEDPSRELANRSVESYARAAAPPPRKPPAATDEGHG